MNKQQLIQILGNTKYQNGSYIKIGYEKDLTTQKGKSWGHKIAKYTAMTVRLGINYTNTEFAKARLKMRAEGAPIKETWYNRTDCKYVVEHKTNGKQYLQVFTSPNKSHSRYQIDGLFLNKDEYEQYVAMGVAQKQTPSKGEVCVMTIPLENIKEIGDYIQQY